MITDAQDPIDRDTRRVFRDGEYVGFVVKNATGNWVAWDSRDTKLTECRDVIGGSRQFDYFATRKAAIAAFAKSSR
jgi:hypothetical protein